MQRGMQGAIAAGIVCAGVLLTGCEANAQSIPKDVATRIELYAIPSLTISDQQFLTGDSNGTPVTVAAELRIAQGTGRLPVVVLMHGSSGVGANTEPWVHQFNSMGISTFVIDGFSGRGLTVVGPNQALLGRLDLIVDIYRSLEILAKHPRVDPDRIVLMGFSRGGQAALYASLDRFNKLWNKSGIQFAGYIPFYPDCSTTYVGDTEVGPRPIRIFHGTPDDYNPVVSCKAFVARLQDAKRDVVLTEYPDSQHAFDIGLLGISTFVVSANAQTARNCHIKEGDDGVLMNAGQGIALATSLTTSDEMSNGRLIELFATNIHLGAYYLVVRPDRAADPVIGRFRDWLTANMLLSEARDARAQTCSQ